MPTDSSDSAALKALTKPDDQKLLAKARATIKPPEVDHAFQVLHRFYAARATSAFPIDGLEVLAKYRMAGTVEFVFSKHAAELRSLTIDELLRVAASAKCISAWIGKSEDSGGREAALLARFNDDPLKALSSALSMWFFETVPPKLLRRGLDVFLREPETRPYTPIDVLLLCALTRDQDGDFLGALVSACGPNPDTRGRVVNQIKYNDELVELFVAGAPKAVRAFDADSIVTFIQPIFEELQAAKVPDRKRWWCSKLLSLAAGFALLPPCEVSIAVLKELDRLSLLAEEKLPAGDVDLDQCGIRYHGVRRISVHLAVTHEAAKLIALTLAKIRNGDDPKLSLEATALNLGMQRIASPGTVLEYNPKFHEDVIGGVSPGALTAVQEGGWQYEGKLIQRAQVKPI
jgi:hypothetical protein